MPTGPNCDTRGRSRQCRRWLVRRVPRLRRIARSDIVFSSHCPIFPSAGPDGLLAEFSTVWRNCVLGSNALKSRPFGWPIPAEIRSPLPLLDKSKVTKRQTVFAACWPGHDYSTKSTVLCSPPHVSPIAFDPSLPHIPDHDRPISYPQFLDRGAYRPR